MGILDDVSRRAGEVTRGLVPTPSAPLAPNKPSLGVNVPNIIDGGSGGSSSSGNTYRGGGGGSSSRGSSLSQAEAQAQAKAQAEAQAKAQAEAKARAEEQARQQAQIEQARQRFQANLRNVQGLSGQQSAREQFNKQVSQIQAGKNLNQISTTTPKPTTTSTNKYIVKAGGSVTELNQETGGSRYVGSAYIPELGMTAREYSKKITDEAVKTGIVDKKDLYKSRIRVEEPITSTTSQTIPADKINNIASSNSQYNIIRSSPNLVYGLAPTSKQQYKQAIEREGYVQGTLSFLGGKVSGAIDKAMQKASKKGDTSAFYQQEGFMNIGKESPTALYFIPVLGEGLLIAGGSEKVIKGKTTTEKLIGVGEVGLGLIGLKSTAKSISASKRLKEIEKAKITVSGVRLQSGDRGVDYLVGKTKAGKETYTTIVRQPYIVTEEKTIMEGGKAIGISKTKKGIELTSFKTGGTSKVIETTPRLSKNLNNLKISKQISAEASVSRVFIQPTSKTKITKGLTFPKGELRVNINTKKINVPKEYSTYSGFGSEKEGVISFVSGKTSKARLNKVTGQVTVLSEPSIYGKIKVKDVGSKITDVGSSLISPKGTTTITKSKFSQDSAISITKEITKSISKPSITTSSFSGLIPTISAAEQKVAPSVVQQIEPKTTQTTKPPITKTIQPQKEATLTKQVGGSLKLIRPSERTKSGETFKQIEEPKILEGIKEIPAQKLIQRPKQKTSSSNLQKLFLRTPETPTKPIPVTPIRLRSAIDKVKKMSKESPESFEVFVKKLGKDVSIGIAKTKKEAESILSSELKTTLRASGFVKKGGKRLTAKELDLFGTGFTQSKSDIFRIVQPKTQRLGTKSETREIQYFKKSPTQIRKNKSSFFNF